MAAKKKAKSKAKPKRPTPRSKPKAEAAPKRAPAKPKAAAPKKAKAQAAAKPQPRPKAPPSAAPIPAPPPLQPNPSIVRPGLQKRPEATPIGVVRVFDGDQLIEESTFYSTSGRDEYVDRWEARGYACRFTAWNH